MRSNQGRSASLSSPFTLWAVAQWAKVCAGVRKLEVQLTSVVPPTARPCRMVMAPSLLILPRPSW
ncbi:hypothetical protein D3C76_1595270 [compost metagenome]